MSWIEDLDCQSIDFDANISRQRLERAKLIFGEYILKRILILSLYFCGVKRNEIARLFSVSDETVRSMLKIIMRDGIDALKDRRKKNQQKTLPIEFKAKKSVIISETDSSWQLDINGVDLFIPKKNPLQFKLILLSFSNNKLIRKTEAAKLLKITSSQIAHLERELKKKDISALIDKRQGQQKDYKFTSDIKSELIIQFSTNAALGKSTSSASLSEDIKKRTELQLSPRSIRHHISKFGLKGKSKKLFELIGIKKK